jgi:membrane-associated phospholipid phosphatase
MDVDRLGILILCLLCFSRQFWRLWCHLAEVHQEAVRREPTRVHDISGDSKDQQHPDAQGAPVTPEVPGRLVRSVRPPLVRRVDARRLPWPVWVGAMLGLVVLALVMDWLVGSAYRIDFFSGDVVRELEALGQWGQFSSLVIVGVCLCRLQPARWRRLFDLALAAGVVSLVVLLLKFSVGRLRPMHELPFSFDGVLMRVGASPGNLGSYDIASMPSSHTSAAVVLSLFMIMMWPRLTWFAVVMATIVAFSRVVFVAHWAGDVVVGALVGLLIGYPIIRGFWGVRLLDAVWNGLVDRTSRPALPHVVREEQRALASTEGVEKD